MSLCCSFEEKLFLPLVNLDNSVYKEFLLIVSFVCSFWMGINRRSKPRWKRTLWGQGHAAMFSRSSWRRCCKMSKTGLRTDWTSFTCGFMHCTLVGLTVLLLPLGVQREGHSLSKAVFLPHVSKSAHCSILWKGWSWERKWRFSLWTFDQNVVWAWTWNLKISMTSCGYYEAFFEMCFLLPSPIWPSKPGLGCALSKQWNSLLHTWKGEVGERSPFRQSLEQRGQLRHPSTRQVCLATRWSQHSEVWWQSCILPSSCPPIKQLWLRNLPPILLCSVRRHNCLLQMTSVRLTDAPLFIYDKTRPRTSKFPLFVS